MIRKEGFIELDSELEKEGIDTTDIYTILNSNKIESENYFLDVKFIISFYLNNQKYYYKHNSIGDKNVELIAEELLKDYGLPYIDYDLALIGKEKGVISKDFKIAGARYIDIGKIIYEYYNTDINEIEDHNNLEDIWNSLLYHYRNYPNKDAIVSKLMNRIVDIFIFDIIVCNNDRHSLNYQIMENKDDIDIAPVFDNERILCRVNNVKNVSITMDSKLIDRIDTTLKLFIKESSQEYIDRIYDKIWIISKDNIESVFERVEKKINYPIDDEIKEHYLKQFEEHYNYLLDILEKTKSTRKR